MLYWRMNINQKINAKSFNQCKTMGILINESYCTHFVYGWQAPATSATTLNVYQRKRLGG
jgi:hypothetical protein